MGKRYALLVGPADARLRGIDGDLSLMGAMLEGRDFSCTRVAGEAATRDRILKALAELARDAERDDEVVFYYSGHGGRLLNPACSPGQPPPPGQPGFFDCLLPADFNVVPDVIDEDTAVDFRRVLIAELEAELLKVTAAGARLTVLMDCCYAAMVRSSTSEDSAQKPTEDDFVRRRNVREWQVRGAKHLLEELVDAGVRLSGESDPLAIRLVASALDQRAFEASCAETQLLPGVADPGERGRRCGAMTLALVRALAEIGDTPTPWHVVGRRVRALVREVAGSQSPMLKGPHRRLVFCPGEVGPKRSAGITGVTEDRVTLDVGLLAGVEAGDRFLCAPGPDSPAERLEIEIVEASVATSVGRVVYASPRPEEQLSAIIRPGHAFVSPIAYARSRGRLVLTPSTEAGERLLSALIPASGALSRREGSPVAEVCERNGLLELRRPGGGLLRPVVPFDPDRDPAGTDAGLLYLREQLESVAVGHALRDLTPPAEATLSRQVDVSIERRVAGEWRRCAPGPSGATALPLNDDVLVRVALADNQAAPVHVWVFLVGPGNAVSLFSRRGPLGVAVGGSTPLVIGQSVSGHERGERLRWPSLLRAPMHPTDGQELGGDPQASLVILVADGPADLQLWETGPLEEFQLHDSLDDESPTRATVRTRPPPRAKRFTVQRLDLNFVGPRTSDLRTSR